MWLDRRENKIIKNTILLVVAVILLILILSMIMTQSNVREEFTTPMITVGGDHTIALKNDGTVWTWGEGRSGQLGNGTETIQNTPVHANISNVTAIAAGTNHTVALKE